MVPVQKEKHEQPYQGFKGTEYYYIPLAASAENTLIITKNQPNIVLEVTLHVQVKTNIETLQDIQSQNSKICLNITLTMEELITLNID